VTSVGALAEHTRKTGWSSRTPLTTAERYRPLMTHMPENSTWSLALTVRRQMVRCGVSNFSKSSPLSPDYASLIALCLIEGGLSLCRSR
jgi:hypothetical protein